ncbi:MAG: ComEA family DNA-binding protein [Oscillospiraceae bacterium]|nr:ComEA family DNA-binding protein [Oscillospiraceae bacterium]
MGKSRESVLVVLALLLLAGVLLYNVFSSPALYRAKVHTAVSSSYVEPELFSSASDAFPAESEADLTSYDEQEEPKNNSGRININTADAEELQQLPGIGEVKARRILEDRRENGRFSSPDDLTRVKGIGEKTLEKIRNQITV